MHVEIYIIHKKYNMVHLIEQKKKKQKKNKYKSIENLRNRMKVSKSCSKNIKIKFLHAHRVISQQQKRNTDQG